MDPIGGLPLGLESVIFTYGKKEFHDLSNAPSPYSHNSLRLD